MRNIYLDYAATTPLDPRVREAMEPYWAEEYGNPSSIHRFGERAKRALRDARIAVARILRAKPEEIIFTGGGTESINLAILGVARKLGRGHIITTKIEHHAVLGTIEALEKEARLPDGQGFAITYIDVDEYGLVNPEEVRKALRPDTILVAIMYANNEIGTIEPIAEIAKVVKEFKGNNPFPLFFTDVCQAAGALGLDVEKLGVDLLALNGSKIYGPKGVGCLYVRRGAELEPLIYGGGQERGLRSGTENVPGIVGFAKALEIADAQREREYLRLTELRDYFIQELLGRIPDLVLNGHATQRLPANINISIPGIEGEAAVIYLDLKGIAASTGSACSSTSLEPSHVVLALGKSPELARGSLRFTLGRETTREELDYALEALPEVVAKLRGGDSMRRELVKEEVLTSSS